jgi:hypothetical protein
VTLDQVKTRSKEPINEARKLRFSRTRITTISIRHLDPFLLRKLILKKLRKCRKPLARFVCTLLILGTDVSQTSPPAVKGTGEPKEAWDRP